MRYALKLFYLDKYEGFQRQPDKKTIELYIENALKSENLILDFASAGYVSAGRTDKGVHALSQVIAINTPNKIIIPALNRHLPDNIVFWAFKNVHDEFSPRFDALSRIYRYYCAYSDEDIDLMNQGAKLLEGIHDFKCFSKKHPEKSTIRELYQIRVARIDSFLLLEVTARSFLWQMVRRIADCLMKVGKLEWELEDLRDLLKKTPKSNVYTTARPIDRLGSLFLWDIEYPFAFQPDLKSITQLRKTLTAYLTDYSLKRQVFQDLSYFYEQL